MRYQDAALVGAVGQGAGRKGRLIMTVLRYGIGAAVGVAMLCIPGVAGAQENLDQGKTPAQLFASNCSICHKSPQGLAKAGGILGLDSFLREHYTASKESAGALAAYLKSMDTGPAAPARVTKRSAKGDEKTRPDEKKKPGAKGGEQKGTEKKPESGAEPNTPESKPADAKPSDGRPADIVAPEPKSGEAKSSPPATGETKPAEGGKSEKSN
jgi:mono/diheme cytochrome c family protein